MSDQGPDVSSPAPQMPPRPAARRSQLPLLLPALGFIALGAAAATGVLAVSMSRDSTVLAAPTAIATLAPSSQAAVKGRVAEIFGNKFVIQDPTGRALVETGRRGEDGNLVAKDETVTVQGRFEHGFVHGDVLVHEDGRAESLRPRPPGPKGWVKGLQGPGVDVTDPSAPRP